MDPEAAAMLRSTICTALIDVAAPIDVLIDRIVVPYSIDPQFLSIYYRSISADLAERKATADAMATMVRYPSFISAAWLTAVRTGKPSVPRYSFIGYSITPVGWSDWSVAVVVDGQTTDLIGCPASDAFRISGITTIAGIRNYILLVTTNRQAAAILVDFAETGHFDDYDLFRLCMQNQIDSAALNRCYQLLPVLHAYRQLNQFVAGGVCFRRFGICGGCIGKPNVVKLDDPAPDGLVDELFDF